jgi:hypothetical protein
MATTVCLEISVGVDVSEAALQFWVFSQLNAPGAPDLADTLIGESVTEADVDAIDEFEGVVGVSRFAPITAEPGEVDRSELFAAAVRLWGADFQSRMVAEECGELLASLSQCLRGRTHAWALAEEVADVRVMLEQIPHIAEAARPDVMAGMTVDIFRSAVEQFFAQKIDRLERMVEAGRKVAS